MKTKQIKQITKIFNDSKFNNTDVSAYSLILSYTCEGKKFQFTNQEVGVKWKGMSSSTFSRSASRLIKGGFIKVMNTTTSGASYMQTRILAIV